MTTDEARLRAHNHAMAHDPVYAAAARRLAIQAAARHAPIKERLRRRRAIRRAGWLEGRAFRDRLALPRVWARGRRWRSFLTDEGYYDFAADVRELICEPVQFDRVAMWADPRERL
jgi:hypothetical protein